MRIKAGSRARKAPAEYQLTMKPSSNTYGGMVDIINTELAKASCRDHRLKCLLSISISKQTSNKRDKNDQFSAHPSCHSYDSGDDKGSITDE